MKLPFSSIIQYSKDFYQYAGSAVFFLFLLNLGTGIVELLGIGLLLPVLNMGFGNENSDSISQLFEKFFSFIGYAPTLSGLLLLLVLVFIFKALAVFLIKYLSSATAVNLKGNLQRQLIDRISDSSYSYYTSLKSGWLNNILMKETALFTQGFLEFVRMQTTLVYIIVYLATASLLRFDLMLVILVMGILMMLPLRLLMKAVRAVSQKLTKRSGLLSASFSEFIENFIYTKATGAVIGFKKDIHEKIVLMNQSEKKLLLFSAFMSAATEPVAVVALAVLVYTQVVLGTSALPEVLILGLLLYRIVGQVMLLQGQWQRFNSTFGSIEIVKSTLVQFSQNAEPDGQTHIDVIDTIKFNDVSFSYDDKTVLDKIDIEIEKNKMVGFVGPSGSGKTTLFYMITGLLAPSCGNLILNGHDYSILKKSTIREHIGYVSQTPAMVDGTIAENINFGSLAPDDPNLKSKIIDVLHQAGLEEFINNLDKPVGERGMKLSGGQRQRIAIARELLRGTDLLILDEATSALDEESDQKIQETLKKLKGMKTIIIISHKPSNVQNCDFVFSLKNGKLV